MECDCQRNSKKHIDSYHWATSSDWRQRHHSLPPAPQQPDHPHGAGIHALGDASRRSPPTTMQWCVYGERGVGLACFCYSSVVSDRVFLLHFSIVLWVHANDANGQKLLQMGGRREEKRRKRSGNKKIQFSLQLATEDRSNSCLTCKLLGMSDTETETVCSFRMGSSKSVMMKSPNVVPCFLSRIFTRSVSIAARIVLQGMTCFYHR